MIPNSKLCPKCGLTKERDADFFRRSGKNSHLPRSYCKDCERTSRKIYDASNPEKVKKWDANGHRKYLYGLSPEDYAILITSTDGKCEICLRQKRLVIDHDHETGIVRGILCHGCNAALGIFGDTASGVEKALKYLTEYETDKRTRE